MDTSNYLSDRLTRTPSLKTIEMASRARKLRAEGREIINLSLGQPDFFTPGDIKVAAKQAIDGNVSFYSPIAGFDPLRDAIVEKFRRDNGLNYQRQEVMASTGAKQCLANLVLALVNPGDEVIIPTPYWASYPSLVRFASGEPVFVQTKQEEGYKLTAKDLLPHITPKTKCLILNTPCNPTGAVYSEDELKALAEVLIQHPKVIVISDEIYEHICFGGKHTSMAAIDEMKMQTAVVNGLSKSFAMTGWRLGFLAGPGWLVKACEQVQTQVTSGACSISQMAGVAALSQTHAVVEEMRQAYQARRDTLIAALSEIDGFKLNTPEGAFYAFPNVEAYLGKTLNGSRIESANDLSLYLLSEAGVATVPGEAFGDPHSIRLSFAVQEKTLIAAVEKIKSALL